jgi:hypothetical protein
MILGLLLCVVVAGCATFKNTPRQDYTWEIGRACSGESAGTIQLTRVEPAGRYWYFGGPAEFSWFRECMTRKFQETPYKAWLEQHKADYEAKR